MTGATQREQVRRHLLSGASLTPLDALRLYGVGRLAPRVKELRAEGLDIIDDRKTMKVRHSVYRLRTFQGQGVLMALNDRGRPE